MNYYTVLYYGFFSILFVGTLWCMYQITLADWRRRIIPDAFLFPLLIAGLIVTTFFHLWPIDIHTAVIGAAFGYTLSTSIGFIFDYIIRRKNPDTIPPIGMGDIKLIATGGIWLGVGGLAWALAVACILGIAWGRHNSQKYIPFAPFFVIGGILSFLGMTFLL